MKRLATVVILVAMPVISTLLWSALHGLTDDGRENSPNNDALIQAAKGYADKISREGVCLAVPSTLDDPWPVQIPGNPDLTIGAIAGHVAAGYVAVIAVPGGHLLALTEEGRGHWRKDEGLCGRLVSGPDITVTSISGDRTNAIISISWKTDMRGPLRAGNRSIKLHNFGQAGGAPGERGEDWTYSTASFVNPPSLKGASR